MAVADDRFVEIRDAVRALCADFPDEYFRRVDAARAYQVAPISSNRVLSYVAEHVLGLPRSY